MTDLLERLGTRARRRMTPRGGIALAGAGSFVAVAGAIGLGSSNLTTSHGDIRRIPGMVVSVALIAVGILLLTRMSSGPIAVAGATAEAIGFPALVFFATVDNDDFPPFDFKLILLVSTIVWLAAYFVPPSRGRAVFLTLALIALPLFVMEQVEHISQTPVAVGAAFSHAFSGAEQSDYTIDADGNVSFDDEATPDSQPAPALPDPTNLGIIALLFGAAYTAASFVLSRRLFVGTATPLAVWGDLLLVIGTIFLADDLREIPTGLLLAAIGVVLAFVGASSARRFTTWFGGASFATGVIVLIGKATDGSSKNVVSIVSVAVGAAVVIAAHLAMERYGEPAEEDERRSFRPAMPPRATEAGQVPGP